MKHVKVLSLSVFLILWELFFFVIDVASLVTSYIEHSMGSEKRSILDEFEELLLKELVEKRNYEKRILFVVVYYFSFASIRSSRSQMFFKTGVLKKLAMFTEKHLRWSLFLIKSPSGLHFY